MMVMLHVAWRERLKRDACHQDRHTERGMTKNFDSFGAASDALRELVQDAQKKGWKRAERAGGFKPRPDAFTTIATPPLSKGKK